MIRHIEAYWDKSKQILKIYDPSIQRPQIQIYWSMINDRLGYNLNLFSVRTASERNINNKGLDPRYIKYIHD